MTKRKYVTNKGTFVIDSNRELTPDELDKEVDLEDNKFFDKEAFVGSISKNLKQAASDVHTEGVGVLTSFANQRLLGLPKAGLEKVSPEAAEFVFPEPRTFQGKIAKGGADITGFLKGAGVGAGGYLSKLVAGSGPARAGIREAIKFGTAGALQTPDNAEGDLLAPRQRAFQAAFGAFGGPIGTLTVKALGLGTKFTGKVASRINEGLKRHGVSLQAPDFVRQTLAPKLSEAFQGALQKFDNNFQSFALRKMRIPKEQISHISKRTPQAVTDALAKSGGKVDDILAQADDSILQRTQSVDNLYEQSLNSVEGVVVPKNALKLAKDKLTSVGFRGTAGDQLALARVQGRNKAFAVLDDFFEQNNVQGSFGTPTRFTATPGSISKEQFIFWRDAISKAQRGATDSERRILKQMSDALHKDAEVAGFKGITKARDEFAILQDVIETRGGVTEKNLEGIFNLDAKKLSTINKLERQTGVKIAESSKDIISGKTLEQKLLSQKLDEAVLGETEFFAKQLDSALNSAKTTTIKKDLTTLLGNEKLVDQAIDDLISFKQIQQAKKVGIGVGATVGGALLGRQFGLFGGGGGFGQEP